MKILSPIQIINLFRQVRTALENLQRKVDILEQRVIELESDPFKMPFD